MGNALKISNVDFSLVAVDRVTYVEEVPCTGIELDQNTITVEKAEGTAQLVATVSPLDTTDPVIWSSSNENVATVLGGLVTVHGIGTATITATCGEQSATATVTQTTLKAQYDFKVVTGVYAGSVTVSGDDKILALTVDNTQASGGQGYTNTDNLRMRNGNSYDIECIKVPYGATIVKFVTKDGNRHSVNYIEKVDTTTLVTDSGIQYPKYIEHESFIYSDTGKSVSYGMAFAFRGSLENVGYVDYVYFE